MKHRVSHWDQSIRELAAKSLSFITPIAADCIFSYNHSIMFLFIFTVYITGKILPLLLTVIREPNSETAKRHGTVLAIAEILVSITNNEISVSEEIVNQIRYSRVNFFYT